MRSGEPWDACVAIGSFKLHLFIYFAREVEITVHTVVE
jgi:hypothetical protein